MYFHHFRHLGRHLEFLKTLNDDRLSSSRILNGNVLPTRIHQEKKLYTRLPGPSKICPIRAGLIHRSRVMIITEKTLLHHCIESDGADQD